jgi:hypothetical protein
MLLIAMCRHTVIFSATFRSAICQQIGIHTLYSLIAALHTLHYRCTNNLSHRTTLRRSSPRNHSSTFLASPIYHFFPKHYPLYSFTFVHIIYTLCIPRYLTTSISFSRGNVALYGRHSTIYRLRLMSQSPSSGCQAAPLSNSGCYTKK